METKEKQFDVQAIANYLLEYKEQLPELYKWDKKCDDPTIFDEQEIKELEAFSKEQIFEKDKRMREIIRKKLRSLDDNESDRLHELYIWIVKKWGGIKGGNDTNLLKWTKLFLDDKPNFDRIASSSKIGAFLHPDKYVIYDSRIAYSLNWIILKQDAGKIFFPIPAGQNVRKNAIDVGVLIRLKNIEHFKIPSTDYFNNPKNKNKFISKQDSELFIPDEEAYSELNKLIQDIHRVLWSEEPLDYFKTEMLLFTIADTIIYKDITDSVKLQID